MFILGGVAYITLCERHFLGSRQQRVGPNKVRLQGVLQPVFDGVKLVKKEQLVSFHSSNVVFILVPGILFVVMFINWFLVSYCYEFFTIFYAVMFFLCLIGFSVYRFLMRGIRSKSKYGLLGALRARRQRVAYEVVFSLFIIRILVFWCSFVFCFVGRYENVLLMFFFFFTMLAELNRAPFDFLEGERELVRGYNVEFGRVLYALLYIGEYGILLFFCYLFSVIFFWARWVVFYVVFCILIFVRSSFPRLRYDIIMGFF